MTKIACSQFAPTLGDVSHNLTHTLKLIRSAAEAGAEVVVLPELASCGYVFADTAEARLASEPADGSVVKAWQEITNELGIVMVGGFCEAGADGNLYNSAALIVPNSEPIIYRKVHLWDRERLIFTPGSEPMPVVNTAVGRIGVMICYDLEFPEWVRIAALRGADLICAPVNWPKAPRPNNERPAEVVKVQAQASMNRIAIAVCDRAGTERGVEWTSASVIVDADGWPQAEAHIQTKSETTIIAEIDILESRNKSIAEYSNVMSDRRPELYASVLPE